MSLNNAIAIREITAAGRTVCAGGPGSGRHVGGGGSNKPIPTKSQHEFMKSVLSNDEASSDKELHDHFVGQGVHPDVAKDYVSRRDSYLKGQ